MIVEMTDGDVREYDGDYVGLIRVLEGLEHVRGYELKDENENEGELRWPLRQPQKA